MVFSRRRLPRLKMLGFLDEMAAAASSGMSKYMPAGSPAPDFGKMAGIAPEEVLPELVRAVARSTTGAVLFWGEEHRCLVLPPFPVTEGRVSIGYDVEPLRSLLRREFTVALILVRLGAYAIGVFQGEKLLSSKVGTGQVHSRHKKGGSSQRRFERGREKEIEFFFERVCTHVREHLEPYVRQLDYVVYGGERYTVLAFRKQCQFLHLVDERTLGKLLNVRQPRQATLEAAIGEAWCSEVIQWYEIQEPGVTQ